MSNELATIKAMEMVAHTNEAASLADIREDSQKFPRIIHISRPYALRDLSVIISQALLYRGQDADADKVTFMASALLDELLADELGLGLKFITLEEIRRVAKKAALDKDTFGISVATLYSAIVAYAKTTGAEAQREANQRKRNADARVLADSPVGTAMAAMAAKISKTHKI